VRYAAIVPNSQRERKKNAIASVNASAILDTKIGNLITKAYQNILKTEA